MNNEIKQLTDPNSLYIEMNQILNELAMDFLSNTQREIQEDTHGESISAEELEYKKKMTESVTKDPNAFIITLPFKLDAINRATASLMARNNDRLLRVVYDLIPQQNGQLPKTDS